MVEILKEALRNVANAYQSDCDRLPTVNEFAKSIETVLGADPDDYLSEMDSTDIKEIRAVR